VAVERGTLVVEDVGQDNVNAPVEIAAGEVAGILDADALGGKRGTAVTACFVRRRFMASLVLLLGHLLVGPVGLEPTTRGLKVRSSPPSQTSSGDGGCAVAPVSHLQHV